MDEIGGATPKLVCELTCGETSRDGLTPGRIVCGRDGGLIVVVYFNTLGRGKFVRTDPVALASVRKDETFQLEHGRDVCIVEEEGE